MVKLTFCLRRQAHLTHGEFSRYWREIHAPLVRERAEILGIRRYVQVHTTNEPELHEAFRRRNGGAPIPFDGIAELWFDDVEAFRRPRSEEARHAARELLEDERRFIDPASSPMWLGEEWDVLAAH